MQSNQSVSNICNSASKIPDKSTYWSQQKVQLPSSSVAQKSKLQAKEFVHPGTCANDVKPNYSKGKAD